MDVLGSSEQVKLQLLLEVHAGGVEKQMIEFQFGHLAWLLIKCFDG